MFAFWGLTGLAAAGAALLILSFARRAELARDADVADDGPTRELADLERLRARGLLDDAGFDQARTEVARRALAAGPESTPVAAGATTRRWVPIGAAVAVLAAGGLYFALGRPGMPDQPMTARVAEWAATPQTLDAPRVAAVMAEAVRRNPGDPQALALLGAARFEAGDPVGAASAFRRLLVLRPDDAQAWARLGESLVRAAEGRIDGDAEAAFREALRLDPNQLGARYFLGEAARERGDAAGVREMWGPLIAALDPADPRRTDLVARMPGGAS
jgi:cytochrome c-type biogenesis protein CcmH